MKDTINNTIKINFKPQDGFSLVELIIYISLVGIVLSVIYNLYYFSNQGSTRSLAESEVIQDSRIIMMNMEREIRQAIRPRNYVNLPDEVDLDGLPNSYGLEIKDSGNFMTIYSYINNEPRRIEYRVVNSGEYFTMERSVTLPLLAAGSNWDTILENILRVDGKEIFTIDGYKVTITYSLQDSKSNLNRPLHITNTYTVRSRGAL